VIQQTREQLQLKMPFGLVSGRNQQSHVSLKPDSRVVVRRASIPERATLTPWTQRLTPDLKHMPSKYLF
jgi:hypothetical protein